MMTQLVSILIHDLGGTRAAWTYARSVATTAANNGNVEMAGQYFGAMAELEKMNAELAPVARCVNENKPVKLD